jgi:ABC-type antimicrobial peptide transport system permease subunit
LLIAVAGIASMLVLLVRQRTREFGIRIALGAAPRDIVSSVIREGMSMVGAGLILGLGGAFELTRFLRRMLFEVQPTDVTTYALVSVLFLSAALIACAVPAYRAARIDPQTALRCD